MARMDRRGPENIGPATGRGLGKCRNASASENYEKLGQGMGLRRNSGGGKGKGKRLKSNLSILKK